METKHWIEGIGVDMFPELWIVGLVEEFIIEVEGEVDHWLGVLVHTLAVGKEDEILTHFCPVVEVKEFELADWACLKMQA